MDRYANPANIEQLVQQFYRPGQPQEIKKIEDHLQTLQFSEVGWQLADALLQSEDRNVRFFGALTFTVKIKRDSGTLDEVEAALLLDRLLQHLVRLVNRGESALVVKKLCNALIAYYLLPSTSWQQPVLSVMVSLAQGQGLTVNGLSHLEIASSLGNFQLLATLWFAMGLAEEAKQALVVNTQALKYDARVGTNVHDVAFLLEASMNVSTHRDGISAKHVQEGMKCFQSWIMYAQRMWIDQVSQLRPLQVLTPLAIQALNHEELYEESAELLSDILSNFSIFLTASDYRSLAELLSGTRVQDMVTELITGDHNPEAAGLTRLCLAYGEASVQDLAHRDDANLVQILRQLIQLLNHVGYPGVEDEDFCSQALGFWQIYAEFITDSLYTLEPDQKPPWMHVAQERVLQVLEICWIKIRQPPSDVALNWDTDERTNFQAFRNDVQDILQTSYTLLGINIFEKFAWLALKSLEEQAWLQLEASLFCLNALSEAVSEEITVDDILSNLFGSSIFSEMASREDEIPVKTRQAAVTMITKFISFFERHNEYLPAMLTFLFQSLRAPALGNVVAKAIYTACSSCRKTLAPELNAFIHQYEVIQRGNGVDTYTKENVIGGITAIVQALPTDESKLEPTRMLLNFIESDVRTCLDAMKRTQADPSNSEIFQAYGIGALKCLASMGKALQTPDDAVIDLDAEAPRSVFWTSGAGATLQQKVINIIERLTSLMYWNSDIMETGCQILRSGFRETVPGLFVFPPQTSVSFLLSALFFNDRVYIFIYTAAAMLSFQSSSSAGMPQAASTCLDYSIKLLAALDYNPSAEPEVAASIIDLADKCIPHYLVSMRHLLDIEKLFSFALSSLASPEIMPNRSAAHFWSIFVQRYDLVEEARDFQAGTIQKYGPVLCQILIHGIAGQVPRSSLDTLAEPLKKLVFAQPQAKQWISAALDHSNFPSQKVDAAQKRVWLQKVMSLRGAKKTNNEVKDFWVACRGPESNFAF